MEFLRASIAFDERLLMGSLGTGVDCLWAVSAGWNVYRLLHSWWKPYVQRQEISSRMDEQVLAVRGMILEVQQFWLMQSTNPLRRSGRKPLKLGKPARVVRPKRPVVSGT